MEKYIFFVRKLRVLGRFGLRSNTYLCTVDKNNITVRSDDQILIPLDSIKEIKIDRLPQTYQPYINIDFQVDGKDQDYIFQVIDPVNPRFIHGDEIEVFVKIVKSIKDNQEITITPNPYSRSSNRGEWVWKISAKDLDPSVKPWIYYDKYHEKTSVGKLIFEIVITLIVTSLVILFMAYLAGGFN